MGWRRGRILPRLRAARSRIGGVRRPVHEEAAAGAGAAVRCQEQATGFGRRAAPAATPHDVAGLDLLRIRRGMTIARGEIKCDACGGAGSLPVRQSEPGRRICPGSCTKCGGQGRTPWKDRTRAASRAATFPIRAHVRFAHPPSVHQMIVTHERNGFTCRQPGVPPKHRDSPASRKLAHPRMARYQNVKITGMNH